MKAHTEAAFETLIFEHLLEHGGYVEREPGVFDAQQALIPEDLLGVIEETQPKVWKKQWKIHGDRFVPTLLAAFHKATVQLGVLHVLRHGFKFYGSLVRVASFQPAHGLNPEVEALYRANRLAVARQVHFDPKNPKLSLDLVLFLNGIPIVTAELKNALTRQTARHAQRQYRDDRDPDAPIFRFKERALVHFALGADEVWMTTRLARGSTFFLPFNRGDGTAAGNRAVEGKHRTHYLWEEVWQRDSLMDILARFLHLEVKEKKRPNGRPQRKETLIFPRYHQLDCVRELVKAARTNGTGTNFLVQHSAGSGKSNTIAWLAYRLASLHDEEDRKVYDSVVVITDRRVLDQQLQDTIDQFEHKRGVVRLIEEGKSKSRQLATALEEGVAIVVCTLHSFGKVADKIEQLPHRRYAVLVDEAHSSQSGDMAKTMKEILGAGSIAARFEEEADDVDAPDQAALRAALARGPQANLSYFAFTATPKFKTLELFGHKDEDGKPVPYHLYSMRQAIQEKFILDVLLGYTTYKRYFQLVKAVAEDPELDKRKASRALARFVSLHPVNVAQKTEVMIEHFRACVMHQLGGKAKAMVVTPSRLHAVKYKLAFDRYLEEKGYTGVGVLVAFSGEVRDPDDPSTADHPYTEPEMNRHPKTGRAIKESELPTAFAGPAFNLLIVANKYQTGFDQPLLSAMYVDKRLSGIQAVQTLSRLNRMYPGKEQAFVLDFVNEREEILESFQTYYEGTTVAESVDPQRLYELQRELDGARIYRQPEVDHFARLFFKPGARQTAADNGRLHAALDLAVDRFKATESDEAEAFRDRLQAYCNLYGFLSQVVPFSDPELEKLYVFGRKLLHKLPPKGESTPAIELGEDVALSYYRLQKEAEGAMELRERGGAYLPGPTDTGTGAPETPQAKLSTLIATLNERFGTAFEAQDYIEGIRDQLVGTEHIQRAAEVNDKENFRYVLEPALDEALIDRHAKHATFIDRIFADEAMLQVVRKWMLDAVYGELRGEAG